MIDLEYDAFGASFDTSNMRTHPLTQTDLLAHQARIKGLPPNGR
ncbi:MULTISPECIES: hypothetical protein [Roseobacteraceae]|nr:MULTISPECIES: hypothetical protein [Roseobacteraceae]